MELTIEQALQQGIAAHKEGKLQEAERLYRAVLQFQPAHADANHNLGVLAVSVNKAEIALPLFKMALETNPRIEQFWLSYIDALIKEQQCDNAKQVLEQAKARGVAEEKLNALQTLLTTTAQVDEPKLAVHNKSLSFSKNSKKLFEQKKSKKKARKQNFKANNPPQEQQDYLLELYKNGRFSDAEKLARTISKDFPNHPFSWKVLGALLGATGRKSEAVDANQTAVALSPKDAEAHNNLGSMLKELGRLDEAEASYNQAIALKPDLAEAHSSLSVTLQELGRLDEAEASSNQAIALKPDFAEAYNNLGNTLRELGRLDEAEANYNQAIVLKPDYAQAHNNLGVTLQELGRLSEAEVSWRQAIALEPDYAKAHDHLGVLLQSLGKFEEAEVCYKTYLSLKPLEIPLTKSMASKFFTQGEFQKALDLFDGYNTPESRRSALECLHALGNIKEIYTRIEDTAELDDGNLSVAAFASFIAECQQKDTAHRFCKKPLQFIHSSNISANMKESNSFITNLIEDLRNISTTWEPPKQSANGGFQTVGNLFTYPYRNIATLKEIILNEIDVYYEKFKNEHCSFIEKWPAEKNIKGWHIILKEQGYHNLHIHQEGWLSGVIYLKVVPSLNKNEGAITFNLASSNKLYPDFPKQIHNPEVGDILLFPSSLYHGTIPFSTDTDRIVVSFDLMPGNSILKGYIP